MTIGTVMVCTQYNFTPDQNFLCDDYRSIRISIPSIKSQCNFKSNTRDCFFIEMIWKILKAYCNATMTASILLSLNTWTKRKLLLQITCVDPLNCNKICTTFPFILFTCTWKKSMLLYKCCPLCGGPKSPTNPWRGDIFILHL